jgi:putative transposase
MSYMARPLRIQEAGLSYHITARGNRQVAIYDDDDDREEFLALLSRAVEVHGVECHAYCMMTNHYHLVLTTARANLSRAIKDVNGKYGQWWNRRHGYKGHLFQGRFGAQVIQDDAYLLTACRYVVLNPVRAQLVQAPEQWRWSSYRATAGLTAVPSFLRPDTVWHRLGDSDFETMACRYRAFVAACEIGVGMFPRDAVLGDSDFVGRFKDWRARASREVPRSDRQSQPPLATLFAGAVTRAARKAQAARANALGYTLAEIARHLEVHYSTVSRMIGRATGTAEPQRR